MIKGYFDNIFTSSSSVDNEIIKSVLAHVTLEHNEMCFTSFKIEEVREAFIFNVSQLSFLLALVKYHRGKSQGGVS